MDIIADARNSLDGPFRLVLMHDYVLRREAFLAEETRDVSRIPGGETSWNEGV